MDFDHDRHCWIAVLHREQSGGCHVHVLHARVDLETGLSHNVAPPRHSKSFDALRDYYNYSQGWDRPDDPALARNVQPSHGWEAQQLRDAWANGEPTSRATAKAQITDFLLLQVERGLVTNREDMVTALAELGEITRQGKDYIGIQLEGFDQALRLKGLLYHEQFDSNTYGQNRRKDAADRDVGGIDKGVDCTSAERDRRRSDPMHIRLAAEALERLEAAIARRSEYNARYYQKRNRKPVPDHRTDDTSNPAAQPDFKTEFDRDGLLVFNPDGLERRADSAVIGSRLVTHADQLDGRTLSSGSQLGSSDRPELDNVPISAGQPQSLQTDLEVRSDQHHEPERVTDDFAEYLAGINSDYQRAAAHAHATAQELLKVREKRRADAKQRVDELAQIISERDAHRRTQQLRPDLAELREQSEGLRRGAEQQSGIAKHLTTILDRFVAALGTACEQVNRFIEKFRLEPRRLPHVFDDVSHTYPARTQNVSPNPVATLTPRSKPDATLLKDESNDFTN
ncbi:MAG: hypothetical protein KGO49_14080 [Gammaproteobacteria bacterium]|nr:hypothetical protein [Gammaproteobacteria bacterium]